MVIGLACCCGDLFGDLDEIALTEDRYWTAKEDPCCHADESCDGENLPAFPK